MNASSTPVPSAAAISAATSIREGMASPDRARIRWASGEARKPARSIARRTFGAQQQVLQPMLDTIADDMDAETPASEPVAVPATAVPDSGLPSLARPTPPAAPEAPAAPETTEATEAPANQ